MNKKDEEKIKEIFRKRFKSLTFAAGDLALELKHQIITQDEYDKEINDIDYLMDILFYLEDEILEGQKWKSKI